LLYRFDRQPSEGLVTPGAYLLEEHVEWITPTGSLQRLAYEEVKAICFASESGATDLFTQHNAFERRPKVPGLWTRFTFRDGDVLEGILPHNLLDWPKAGFLITPPRAGASRQRVLIPRTAVRETELRGVVGTPAPRARRQKDAATADQSQLRMFE
jgi:uncharacterized protein DUF6982